MPIYQNNGTTNAKVKKRYLFNGTASAEVKKRYAFDGTANILVYSSGLNIYENGVTNTDLIGSWVTNMRTGDASVTFGPGSITHTALNNAGTGYWAHAIIWTANKIDFTGYTKLCRQISSVTGAAGARTIINALQIPGTDNPQLQSGSVEFTTTSAGLFVADISNYQFPCYVGLDVYLPSAWGANGTMTETKIWLE